MGVCLCIVSATLHMATSLLPILTSRYTYTYGHFPPSHTHGIYATGTYRLFLHRIFTSGPSGRLFFASSFCNFNDLYRWPQWLSVFALSVLLCIYATGTYRLFLAFFLTDLYKWPQWPSVFPSSLLLYLYAPGICSATTSNHYHKHYVAFN